MEQTVKKDALTLTDVLRARFKGVLDPAAAFFGRMGFSPNSLTLFGLLGNIAGSALIATGNVSLGGLVILLMGPIDALDGALARKLGLVSEYGAFLDSVTDRYSELVILGGLLLYYLQRGEWLGSLLVYLAAGGSVLVSYTRARAQSLGMDTKVGLFTRVERFIVLAPCLIINQPMIALWATAILANVTAFQRIWHVRKQAYERKEMAR